MLPYGIVLWGSGNSRSASGAALPVMCISEIVIFVIVASIITVSVKRFHDLDKSGWYYLLALIPFVGGLIIFVYCGFIKGTTGPNKYGDDPTMPQELNDQFRTGESISNPVPQSNNKIWIIVAVVVGVVFCLPVLVISVLTLLGPNISHIFNNINSTL